MTIPVTRRVETQREYPNGATSKSWSHVPDGTLTGTVLVDIDVDGLVKKVAARALRNRTRRATAAHGLVVARATNLVRDGGQA